MHTGEFRGSGPIGGQRMSGTVIDKQTALQILEGKVTIQRSGKSWVGSIASDDRLLKAIRGMYRIKLADGSLFDVNIEDVVIEKGTWIDFTGVGSPP